MTLLYLVRHGETDWNLHHRIQGSTDIPLNATGREQAATTGRLLKRRSFDAVLASPLSRARETASIIGRELGLGEPSLDPALVERQYGEAEGLSWEEVQRRFPEGVDVPGRETREQVADRVLPALCRIADAHPDQALVVVTHGGVIRSVLNAVHPASARGPITNGSVHSFRHEDGALTLIAFDDPLEVESLGCATDDLDEQNELEAREPVESTR